LGGGGGAVVTKEAREYKLFVTRDMCRRAGGVPGGNTECAVFLNKLFLLFPPKTAIFIQFITSAL
jgi:hypothetical protein